MFRFTTLTRIVIGICLALSMNHGLMAMNRSSSPAPSSVSSHSSLDSIRDGGEVADANTSIATVCANRIPQSRNLNTTLPTMCENNNQSEVFVEFFQACSTHLTVLRNILALLSVIPSTQQQAISDNYTTANQGIATLARVVANGFRLTNAHLTFTTTSFAELINTIDANVAIFTNAVAQELVSQINTKTRRLMEQINDSSAYITLYAQWLNLHEHVIIQNSHCTHIVPQSHIYGQAALGNVQQCINNLRTQCMCCNRLADHLENLQQVQTTDSANRILQIVTTEIHRAQRNLQRLENLATRIQNVLDLSLNH